MEGKLVKIIFPVPEEAWEGIGIETLWAFELGNNLYRLDNTPFYVYGISYRDVVEAEFDEEGLKFVPKGLTTYTQSFTSNG